MNLWKGGIEPLPLDEFCELVGDTPFFPKQKEVFKDAGILRAYDFIRFDRQVQEIILMWGKGCLGEDEQITDFSSGSTKSVKEWAKIGQPITVKTTDGKNIFTTSASPVYKKGQADLFLVELEDGRSFVATSKHQCLTPDGWKHIENLESGSLISATSNIDFLSDVQNGVPNEFHKEKDSQYGYHPSSDFYDEQLLSVLRDVSKTPALLTDVPECIPQYSFREFPVEREQECNHPCQPLVHSQVDTFHVPVLSDASNNHSFSDFSESSLRENQIQLKDVVNLCLSDNSLVSEQECQTESKIVSYYPPQSFTHYISILQITKKCYGDFYDLTVPGTNCYFDSQGILHHNSGKDFVASIVIAYLAYVIASLNSDPTEYYNLRRGDTLSIINVAPNAHLAKAVFFDGYLKKHIQHPLFEKFDIDIPEKGNEITFYRRNPKTNNRYPFLVLRSLHSSSSGLDGFNTIAFVLDEADDFMNADKTKSVAEEIHSILSTSATTRFGSRWLGFVISYPRIVDGFMIKLVERAKSAPQRFYYDVSPTHVVNPKFDINNETVQEEFKNNPAEASAKYLCISEGTIVHDGDGLKPIELSPATIFKGEKEVIRLTTKYGYSIDLTSEHLVIDEFGNWKNAGHFGINDKISLSTKKLQFGTHNIDERIAELIGQNIGDGYYSISQNSKISSNGGVSRTVGWVYDPQDEDLAIRQFNFLEELGLNPKIQFSNEKRRTIHIRTRNKIAYEFLTPLIGKKLYAREKRIPEWYWKSDEQTCKKFLQGLFEADGSITKIGHVTFTSASYELIQDVKNALLMFGIIAPVFRNKPNYNEKWNIKSKESWQIQLTTRFSRRFIQEIGFISKRKQERCDWVLQNFGQKTKEIEDIFVDRIVKKEKIGIKRVYDLYNQPNQRFVANGFIVHNCVPMQTEDAFFEFTEKIDEAVDVYREPVCDIIMEPFVQEVQGVGYVSYISPKIISEIKRVPGREYFLGGDSGHVGDSFVLSVFHIDKSIDAFEFLCPRCVQVGGQDLLNSGRYKKLTSIPEDFHTIPDAHCGVCLITPQDWHTQSLCIGWHRRDEPEFQAYEVGNTKLRLPRVVEDLICEVRPIRKGLEGKNYPVHFTSVEQVCEQLINKLHIPKARLDAWATPQMIQNLRGSCTGCDIDSISMANSQQYKRARCIKTLLYNNCLSLLHNEKRDMEWKRLQRKGYSIQHPSTGSKDIYDAEAIAIFLSLESRVPNIELLLG